jgi:hypothetical protein
MRWFVTLSIIVAALLAAGADTRRPGDPEQLVREANAAFAQKDYDRAAKLYEQAEVLARDPGMVAFNKAAALYRIGAARHREAELCLRYALDDRDAPPERRARALYNLGTTLVQLGRDSDARALSQAVRALRACVGLAADDELRANAGYNLELARLLLAKARASGSSNDPKDDPPQEDPPHKKQPEEQPKDGKQPGDSATQKGTPSGRDQAWLQDPSKGKQKAVETKENVAGRGNLRALPDDDQLQPLDAQDTAAHLRLAVERIMKSQRDARRLSSRTIPGVKDW